MPHRYKEALPWQRLMEIACGVLQLSPQDFWCMTPCEWMASFRGWQDLHGLLPGGQSPMTRRELDYLTEMFPDVTAPRNSGTGS